MCRFFNRVNTHIDADNHQLKYRRRSNTLEGPHSSHKTEHRNEAQRGYTVLTKRYHNNLRQAVQAPLKTQEKGKYLGI